jgi:DNA polymerase-3 subunit gamma/tau
MSYLVLARKWRPQSFADIAGQGHITRTLQNAIRLERIAHAYLFTGVRGVGKTTAARILAKALNCTQGPTPEPCNQCAPCQEITAGNSIDVLEIDGASNRGIDEVRQIIESVRYQPAHCRFKIYIIDEVHQVTKDAFNALLKTLEEPPPSVKFILATTEPHRLPETILSRCQRYDFRRIALREIVQRLSDISRDEGLNITEGGLVLLAREADGSMRDAQSLLEQVLAYAAPESRDGEKALVNEQLLQDILGLAERGALYAVSAAVIQGNARECLQIISQAAVQGRDLCRLSKDLIEHFRNLLIARLIDGTAAGGKPAELLDLPDQEIADLTAQAAELSVDTLLDYFDFMSEADEEITRSSNPRFSLETVLVRLATLPKTLPAAEIVDRLEKLEKRLSERSGSVPVPPPEKVPRVSEPPPERFQKVETADDKGKVWQAFVAYVGREKKLLASHLQSGQPLEVLPGRLKIGVADRHHLSYLQDSETLSILRMLAQRFFGSDTVIDFAQALPAELLHREATVSGVSMPDSDRSTVKEALRIFGGTIRPPR